MEAADGEFIRGLRYVFAARRCDAWEGDGGTSGSFGRLAAEYRRRARTLIGMDEMMATDAAGNSVGRATARGMGGTTTRPVDRKL